MNLAIFDIDGTLVKSNGLGRGRFSEMMKQLFGFQHVSTDWHDYRHATDSGIIEELFETHHRRLPTEEEIQRFQDQFSASLKASFESGDLHYIPKPGARAILRSMLERGWAVALATGNWKNSGVLKLEIAEIDYRDVPGGFADDAISRGDIIRAAERKSRLLHRQDSFESVIYVGDAIWDLRTTKELGIGFLGIGGNGYDEKLRSEGADRILEGYENLDEVFEALEFAGQSAPNPSL